VSQQLRSHLAYLRLGAVAEQLAPALQDAERDKPSYTRFLERLLAVEVEATERRRLEGRLRFASFPSHKTLADIDYDAQPALRRAPSRPGRPVEGRADHSRPAERLSARRPGSTAAENGPIDPPTSTHRPKPSPPKAHTRAVGLPV
jgi:hypothetical protein